MIQLLRNPGGQKVERKSLRKKRKLPRDVRPASESMVGRVKMVRREKEVHRPISRGQAPKEGFEKRAVKRKGRPTSYRERREKESLMRTSSR